MLNVSCHIGSDDGYDSYGDYDDVDFTGSIDTQLVLLPSVMICLVTVGTTELEQLEAEAGIFSTAVRSFFSCAFVSCDMYFAGYGQKFKNRATEKQSILSHEQAAGTEAPSGWRQMVQRRRPPA